MLVLSRKASERIQVGEAIVTVVEIANGRVRIGIEAPQSVNISRLGPAVSSIVESARPVLQKA